MTELVVSLAHDSAGWMFEFRPHLWTEDGWCEKEGADCDLFEGTLTFESMDFLIDTIQLRDVLRVELSSSFHEPFEGTVQRREDDNEFVSWLVVTPSDDAEPERLIRHLKMLVGEHFGVRFAAGEYELAYSERFVKTVLQEAKKAMPALAVNSPTGFQREHEVSTFL